ncbi:hypothetical protein [Jiulongibacter sediminis]|uniref:hypothetical protein n=1 Tax=Jiulongibacter sediminis TaxID=1605367 RepID=UPI0026EF4D8E|nr:hypothetical protein [Jiulongibacter sediminis]
MVKRVLFLLIVGLFSACSEPEPFEQTIEDYYPLVNGLALEYEVREIVYSVTEDPKIEVYQLKERLSELSENNFKIEVFKRNDATTSWQFFKVAGIKKENGKIVKTTDGRSEIVLKTGLNNGDSWDKNNLNTSEISNLMVEEKREPYDAFPFTLKVVEKLDSSLIHKNAVYSIYADGIGPVYRERTEVEYCQSSSECIGQNLIDSGRSEVWKLIRSGIE